MGHLLDSEILMGERGIVRDVVEQLFNPAYGLLSPVGIRTLERDAVRFDAGGYHTGQVWLWDNLKIADGLARHGFHGLAWELRARMVEVCTTLHLLPEFVRGGDDPTARVNERVVDAIRIDQSGNERLCRIEQPPQDVQAWSVAGMVRVNALLRGVAAGGRSAPPTAARNPFTRREEARLLRRIGRTQRLALPALLSSVAAGGVELLSAGG